MSDLAALRLMIEWGADEALLDLPVDRFAAPPPPARPLPAPIASGQSAPRMAVPLSAGPAHAAQAAVQAADGAMDLVALHAVMDGFTACPLRATASTTVAPSGNPDAGLLFVFDTPGPDDDRSGQALSGALGARMDRVLGSVGLSRADFLAAPLVPWRPPGGRPVSEPELALCLPFLRRLLALVRPRRMVLLGAGPYRALGGAEGAFRKARGKWTAVEINGLDVAVPALAMLPPDMWLSSAANRQATWADLLTLTEHMTQT